MAEGVLMPKAGITVEECVITEWLKKKGDKVAVGDVLFTYETDKASFECESTAEGELLEIFYGDGEEVPCLVNVCAIGTKGEDVSALRPDGAAPAAAPAAEDAAPSKIVTISQPADDGSVIVMIGQPVERNCGACFPLETGTVVGFVDVPDGVVLRGGVFALVRWDYNPDRPERVRLSDIHRRGWRSANGSPLGVFVR